MAKLIFQKQPEWLIHWTSGAPSSNELFFLWTPVSSSHLPWLLLRISTLLQTSITLFSMHVYSSFFQSLSLCTWVSIKYLLFTEKDQNQIIRSFNSSNYTMRSVVHILKMRKLQTVEEKLPAQKLKMIGIATFRPIEVQNFTLTHCYLGSSSSDNIVSESLQL